MAEEKVNATRRQTNLPNDPTKICPSEKNFDWRKLS